MYLHSDGTWHSNTGDSKDYPGYYPTEEIAKSTLAKFSNLEDKK